MDSMVGYKNYRYGKFGKVAARADDVLNFLPARLAALLLVAAAALVGLDPRGAWRILRRDAAKASSPNAGWPEAAMAGALGVRLGGARHLLRPPAGQALHRRPLTTPLSAGKIPPGHPPPIRHFPPDGGHHLPVPPGQRRRGLWIVRTLQVARHP